MVRAVLGILTFLFAASAGAQGRARLVADLVPGEVGPGLLLDRFASLPGKALFLRIDEQLPLLVVTDGTPAGTKTIAELAPPGLGARHLGTTSTLAFYLASGLWGDGEIEQVVWRSDGTALGTFPVTESFTLPPDRSITAAASERRLFFVACTSGRGCEPWSSDGTHAGTRPLAELVPGAGDREIVALAASGDRAFLLAKTDNGTQELFTADAVTGQVSLLLRSAEFRSVTLVGDRIFFITRGEGLEVWTSDGTAAGTRAVTSFTPDDPFRLNPYENERTASFEGRLYFVAQAGGNAFELWSADGLPGSLRQLTDFGTSNERLPIPHPLQLVRIGARILFAAYDRAWGHDSRPRLWSTRGSRGSTLPVTGCPDGCPRVGDRLGAADLVKLTSGKALFVGTNRGGYGLWATDGTGPGTHRIARPGQSDLIFAQLAAFGDRALYWAAMEYETGELRISDGTAAGTFVVGHGGPAWSHYGGWRDNLSGALVGGRVVFATSTEAQPDFRVWASDGSAIGMVALESAHGRSSNALPRLVSGRTALIESCEQGEQEAEYRLHAFEQRTGGVGALEPLLIVRAPYCSEPLVWGGVALGDIALFRLSAYEPPLTTFTSGLWRSDGTAAGTFRITSRDLAPGQPLAFRGEVAFIDYHQPQPTFWITDGTAAGTRRGFGLSVEATVWDDEMASLADRLYFKTRERVGEQFCSRIWSSDGTTAGTAALTPCSAWSVDTFPQFTLFAGQVYFWRADDNGQGELWSTDGTPAGTRLALNVEATDPRDMAAVGERLYFTSPRESQPPGPTFAWSTDGTAAGTELLATVALPNDSFGARWGNIFVEHEGRVLFAAYDGAHGNELWSTDGTTAGTAMLVDLAPGPPSSYPRELTLAEEGPAAGRLFFRARTARAGMELWQSDGTAPGTRQVVNLAPGGAWSFPENLRMVGDTLLMTANDGRHGHELWQLLFD